MDNPPNLMYSIDDILQELGKSENIPDEGDILVLEVGDKFFVGGGCEVNSTAIGPPTEDGSPAHNVSVCVHGPVV